MRSILFAEINLHYKTHRHLYVYLLLKTRDFLARLDMKLELPFSGGLCSGGLRHQAGQGSAPGLARVPAPLRALCLCWGWRAAGLKAVTLACFTTAKLAFSKTNALKCRSASVAEVGLGFPAGFLGHSVHHEELWEVCKGGKHLKWHHRL